MTPIACDQCGAPAPDRATILADPHGRKGGLRAMGWLCDGGKYACPPCKNAMPKAGEQDGPAS